MESIPSCGDRHAVTTTRVGPIKLSVLPSAGLADLEVSAGDGRMLAAILSLAEVTRLEPMIAYLRHHLSRGEVVYLDVRAVVLDLIGRDPFQGQ